MSTADPPTHNRTSVTPRIVLSNRVLVLGTVAGLVGLAAATVLMKSLHAHVRDDRVRHHMEQGRRYADGGQYDRAAAEYRAVLQLKRDDPQAGRALALTVLALGQLGEGESYLRDLLRKDPTDGPLNRALARVHAARGRDAAARAAYQRAINGEWPGDGVTGRIETHFEFIDYLTRIGATQEILPELLQLRAELPPGHVAAARRAAALLASNSAPNQAIEMLKTAALTAPRDVEMLAQLADLQLDAGRLDDARATLRRAVSIERRSDVLDRLTVVDRVLALDPTLPRLTLVARTSRARLVLQAVMQQTNACPTSSELAALRREAGTRLRRRIGANAERAEEELALAGRIWSAAADCPHATAEARALSQILERTAAAEPLH
jgi:tetratricopeptide (TPR) repeat protein